MRPYGLHGRLVVFFVLLLLAVQVVALALTNAVGGSSARKAIGDELETGERVFARLLEQNRAHLAQGARILSADYAFREALASHDTETIVSALANHGARIRARQMTLVGLDRAVVADGDGAARDGERFAHGALIDAARTNGIASAIAVVDGELRQLVVVPVAVPVPVAWLVIGFPIDDALAGDLQRVMRLEVSFLSRAGDGAWQIDASTLPPSAQAALVDGFVRGGLGHDGAAATDVVQADGDEYVTRVTKLGTLGGDTIVAALQASLATSMEPFVRLQKQLLGSTLVGVLLAVLASVAIARNVSRPVVQLAAFARRIAQGDYEEPPAIRRGDEIGDLASAFAHMREGIVTRESRIMDLAYRDALTGLPNRALFSDRVEQAIRGWRRVQAPLAVAIMDLDHFKYVNDTLGHPIGDLMLRDVAARLRTVLHRQSDTVARLGGDEFAFLLPTEDAAGARLVAERVLQALEAPFVLEGHVVDARASIGIATCPEHGDSLETLMRRADVAMYLAKRNNTGVAIYDPRYDEFTAERLSLMSELRKAVENDELLLHFQPKVSLTSPRGLAVEALIRWQHPTRGLVPPVEFIPFAEQTGYIRAITQWVLAKAIEQAAAWRREGLDVAISLNVSGRDLVGPDLAARLADLLETHGFEAPSLWLEITESAILEDTRQALDNIDRLRALGCRLSIDDYGTGYSSLSYLKRLRVDELKIDKSFVTSMLANRDDAIIVRSTIELAHNMGLKVTAEGVENRAILDALTGMGCDTVQGYLLSRPLPAAEMAHWLRSSPWTAEARRAALRLV